MYKPEGLRLSVLAFFLSLPLAMLAIKLLYPLAAGVGDAKDWLKRFFSQDAK